MRIALKDAGLDAKTVGVDQMRVILERVFPDQLMARGVEDPKSVCAGIASGLAGITDAADGEGAVSPEAIFSRLGG